MFAATNRWVSLRGSGSADFVLLAFCSVAFSFCGAFGVWRERVGHRTCRKRITMRTLMQRAKHGQQWSLSSQNLLALLAASAIASPSNTALAPRRSACFHSATNVISPRMCSGAHTHSPLEPVNL